MLEHELILDAHQHFWKYSSEAYSWIDESMKVLKHDFLPSQLAELFRINGVEGSVAIQARQTLEETRWLLS